MTKQYFVKDLLFHVLDFLSLTEEQRLLTITSTGLPVLTNQISLLLSNKSLPAHTHSSLIKTDINSLKNDAADLLSLLDDQQLVQQLTTDKLSTLQHLQEKYSYSESSMLKPLYDLALINYQNGNYSVASDLFKQVLALSVDKKTIQNALWGKLAADILSENWETAAKELSLLKDTIDAVNLDGQSSSVQTALRSWFLQWSIFPLLHIADGKRDLIDLFMQSTHIAAISSSNAYWLYKYLAVSVVICAPHQITDVAKIIKSINTTDVVQLIVKSMIADYDFEATEKYLKEAMASLPKDALLSSSALEFIEAARGMIFNFYTRIYSSFSISAISKLLCFANADEADNWIVTFIAQNNLNVTMDDINRQYHVQTEKTSFHSQFQDRCKPIYMKSRNMGFTLERAFAESDGKKQPTSANVQSEN